MALVPCVECKVEISSTAEKCPNCATSRPRGATCTRCRQVVNVSQATQLGTRRQEYICDSCARLLFERDAKCFECGALIRPAGAWKEIVGLIWGTYTYVPTLLAKCHKCGVANPLKATACFCRHCQAPILEQLHESRQEVSRGSEVGYLYVHEQCVDCVELERPSFMRQLIGAGALVLFIMLILSWLFS